MIVAATSVATIVIITPLLDRAPGALTQFLDLCELGFKSGSKHRWHTFPHYVAQAENTPPPPQQQLLLLEGNAHIALVVFDDAMQCRVVGKLKGGTWSMLEIVTPHHVLERVRILKRSR